MTSKRNFPRLQAILLGFHAPTDRPALPLKISRAACIRDVCRFDPFKGTELVTGIQVKHRVISFLDDSMFTGKSKLQRVIIAV